MDSIVLGNNRKSKILIFHCNFCVLMSVSRNKINALMLTFILFCLKLEFFKIRLVVVYIMLYNCFSYRKYVVKNFNKKVRNSMLIQRTFHKKL